MIRRERNWESRIGRRLKLRDLDILSTVAECGSWPRAPDSLACPSRPFPNRSPTWRARCGCDIVDRSTLASADDLRAGPAQSWQRGLRRAQTRDQDIEFLADPGAGEVRMSGILVAGFVPAIIDRMSRRYPGSSRASSMPNPASRNSAAPRAPPRPDVGTRPDAPARRGDRCGSSLHGQAVRGGRGAEPMGAPAQDLALRAAHEPWVMFPKDSRFLHLRRRWRQAD